MDLLILFNLSSFTRPLQLGMKSREYFEMRANDIKASKARNELVLVSSVSVKQFSGEPNEKTDLKAPRSAVVRARLIAI
jgi:hypothetical protein